MGNKLKETKLARPIVMNEMPTGLLFSPNLNRKGFYQDLLLELKADSTKIICIQASDKSADTQIRTRAKKLGLTLLIAAQGEKLYFKLVCLTEPQMRILRILKTVSSTLNDLRQAKLECALESTLQELARLNYIKLSPQNKWYILDKGKEELLKDA